jgi:DNA transformation protein
MSNAELLVYLIQNLTKFSITSRNMFGGIGVFSDGVMFALMYDGILYLKSMPAIVKLYAEDSTPFQPPFRRNMTMPYWSVPENVLRDPRQFPAWAHQSLEYAKTTKKLAS